ncbi:MAG TPA: LuxR C-terminal-related transcriptional regulator, partial [Thermomicrobiales bacterium]|nr:LuxR C-terminal-related transcriptional regulator [Thermomicrobiales bacterium]
DLGLLTEAIELISAADALRQRIGAVPGPFQQDELVSISARLRQQVRNETFERHWRAGQLLEGEALVARLAELTTRVSGVEPVSRLEPVPSSPLDALSSREREVMRLLVEGQSAREIGDSLYISPRTVTTHVNNIYGKLEVSTRAQAVALAVRAGFA